jgi:hypothetical protein
LDLFELLVCLDVVPSTVVHPLTKQFNWRLGTVLFLLRHVKVINEDDVLLARGWTKAAFLSSAHSAINNVLGLISWCLSGESQANVIVLFIAEILFEFLLNRDTLACAGGADNQSVFTCFE